MLKAKQLNAILGDYTYIYTCGATLADLNLTGRLAVSRGSKLIRIFKLFCIGRMCMSNLNTYQIHTCTKCI